MMFIYLSVIVTLLVIIFLLKQITKKMKKLNEDFMSSNSKSMTELWKYFNTLNEKLKETDKFRQRVTRSITDHFSAVEKFRMSKKISKPLDKI